MIPRLADLARDGILALSGISAVHRSDEPTPPEARYVAVIVASHLREHPAVATELDRRVAWRDAEAEWERAMRRMRDAFPEEEDWILYQRVLDQLARQAIAHLTQLGWPIEFD